MSNEEMVLTIQRGDTSLLEALWDRVFLLVREKATQFYKYTKGRGGLEIEDLQQIGFFAMVKAVETYDHQMGAAFSSWLCIYLRSYFQAASGRLYDDGTGQNRPKDALNSAASLNTPVGDDGDDCELMDLIEAPSADIEAVEERVWREQLRCVVNAVLNTLPEDQASALRCRFWDRLTYAQTAEKMGVDFEAARGAEHKAIGQLRRSTYRKMLLPFYDFNYYACTGLGAFRNSGMSAQERYVVRKEHLADQYIHSAVRAQKPS